MGKSWQYYPLGESGVLVVMGDRITKQLNRLVTGLKIYIDENRSSGITETVPAYCSLAVYFNPLIIKYDEILAYLRRLETRGLVNLNFKPRIMEIPVVYGNEYGPDLDRLASAAGITVDDFIGLHSDTRYTVGMLGFSPGFPYLIGLPPELAAPRRQMPRNNIPAGSVGIAGQQTGIYPVETPGGWQIIGRTPLRLFDMGRKDPFLLRAGDRVVFKPISSQQFREISKRGDACANG